MIIRHCPSCYGVRVIGACDCRMAETGKKGEKRG